MNKKLESGALRLDAVQLEARVKALDGLGQHSDEVVQIVPAEKLHRAVAVTPGHRYGASRYP